MSLLKDSWSAFDRKIADIYLDGYGSPSSRGKELVASLLLETFCKSAFSLADFGCGNGHLYGHFRDRGLNLRYTGYDFSNVLLEAGRAKYPGDGNVSFVEADVNDPEMHGEPCDVALFSHVLEMLASPEKSLLAAKRLAPLIMIRFFEPPAAQYDVTDVRMLDLGPDKAPLPYLRRTMSEGYYQYLLNAIGCTRVDIHKVDGDKDQVHMLRFG
jgi:ubiquinone/menaquinone biosynthesis C-methylase UbiE